VNPAQPLVAPPLHRAVDTGDADVVAAALLRSPIQRSIVATALSRLMELTPTPRMSIRSLWKTPADLPYELLYLPGVRQQAIEIG
jgi:hypothetical protein